ncbi:MAG: YbaB/EbfC family nucleoid-associated protein [Chloroflexota bacterium]
MSKRRGKSVNPFDSRKTISRGGSGSAGGSKQMLQQLQGLQQEMLAAQEEIAEETFTATAGGGIVTAVVTGDRRLKELTVDPEVVDPDDVEMLQDLIVVAVNKAVEKIEQATSERMAEFTAGLGGIQDLL